MIQLNAGVLGHKTYGSQLQDVNLNNSYLKSLLLLWLMKNLNMVVGTTVEIVAIHKCN